MEPDNCPSLIFPPHWANESLLHKLCPNQYSSGPPKPRRLWDWQRTPSEPIPIIIDGEARWSDRTNTYTHPAGHSAGRHCALYLAPSLGAYD